MPASLLAPAPGPRRRDGGTNGSGSVRLRGKTWTARLSLGEAVDPRSACRRAGPSTTATRAWRCWTTSTGACSSRQIALGMPLLEQAAAREGSARRDGRLAIDQLCRGEARRRPSGGPVPLPRLMLDHADRVISMLPRHLEASSRQAPTLTEDAAGRSTAADAAAEGGPLGPRWATSEPPATAKPPKAIGIAKISGDRSSPTANSWRDF